MDLTGEKFGRLTVVRYEGKSSWLCQCSCGNSKIVLADSLKHGSTRSCGCLRREKSAERLKKYNTFEAKDDYVIGYPSNSDECFLIDKKDYSTIKNHCWYLNNRGYVITNINKRKTLLHRLITNANDGEIVDHINRNKLDNRQSNLRLVTQSKNLMNAGIRSDNTSGAKGVSWHKKAQKWASYIQKKGKLMHLGLFEDFDEAVAVRKQAEQKYFGEFAYKESDSN